MQRTLLGAWRPLYRNVRLAHSNATAKVGKQILAHAPNELLLYYTNLFLPIRVYNSRFSNFLERTKYADVADSVLASFPADLNVSILKTIPRPTEGAAFVKIACSDPEKAADLAATGFSRRWLLFSHRVTGFEVLGVPSITQTPPPFSSVVQVSPALDSTTLDELMHGYGQIRDVKSGSVTFATSQAALTARQCINRYVFRGQELAVVLERSPTLLARFTSWFTGHPRFSLPLLLFVLIGLIGSVFDPIRENSISSKIQGTTTFSWLTKYSKKYLNMSLLGRRSDDTDEFSNQARELNRLAKSAEQLKAFLDESEPTFVVVYGPHGSGKNSIVDLEIPRASDLVLNIDCGKLKNAQGDERKLSLLSRMLGYWPAFPWANRIARLVDLELKGLTGQSAGISETTDQQCMRMIEKAHNALHRLALRGKTDPNQSDEAFLESNAAQRPIVVLRGYSAGERIPELLVEWASDLIVNNIARVLLVTRDASFERALSAALPNRPPKVVNVEDASAVEAREFVLSKFDSRVTNPKAKEAFEVFAKLDPAFIKPLGGRFTDLQMYARRLANGEMPETALQDQIEQAAQAVSLQYLRARNVDWTPEQAWTLVNLLSGASEDKGGWISVPGCVSLTPPFKDADTQTVLEALETQEMISVRSLGGRIIGVKASRPLYLAAFRTLATDGLMAADMNTKVYEQQIKRETAQIAKFENELSLLTQAPAKSREINDRQNYLCAKLGSSQHNINDLETLIKTQRQILMNTDANNTTFAASEPRR